MRTDYQVPMVLKTLKILETFEELGAKLTLTGIARHSRVAKASAFRILETLQSAGYVEKDPDSSHYRLGMKILQLGHTVQKNDELSSLGMPFLLALHGQFNESTNLAVLENGEVLYLVILESSSSLRIVGAKRQRYPIHCTALGKILAAFTPWETVRAILRAKGIAKRTNHTVVGWTEFKREVEEARKKGLAYDDEEFEIGSWCVAAPVFDYTGKIVCALSISAPLARARGRGRELGSAVKAAAAQFSAKLGYQAQGTRRLSYAAGLRDDLPKKGSFLKHRG